MTAERGEWLAVLEAELDRRAARVEREADEGERARQQLLDTLQAMAQRFVATAHLCPIETSDMAPMEKLACRLFLPEHLMPAGLPSEDEIFALVVP
jgi:hypothetical protein